MYIPATQISKLDLQTKEISPMVTHFEGKRLNGPNDLTIDPAGEFLYFTDPIYAYLRKDKFYDAGMHVWVWVRGWVFSSKPGWVCPLLSICAEKQHYGLL